MSEEIIVARESENLSGTVQISGAKNSALKLVAASLLGQGKTTILNVPLISDISIMCTVMNRLGATIEREGHALHIDASSITSCKTPYNLVSKMRASISVLGPLVARMGKAQVAMPGGCQIGARKIDMHLLGMQQLGVHFEMDHGYLMATTPDGLHGGDIVLQFPSVGATENTMMTAVVAKGTTTIDNAAREPEIEDLANMLNAMGAHVEGAGTACIHIEGVPLSSMHPCEHVTVGDRIEAGTFLVGGALMGGPVTVKGVNPNHLRMALVKLRTMGCDVTTTEDSITVQRTQPLRAVDIQTLPYPGFPTDLQAQFMLLAALAEGNSIITENVFENRFMFAAEMQRMGADIFIDDHHAIVRGIKRLQGAEVEATDLRAGAAIVLAGLAAEGMTSVHNIKHIDRGYEDYVGKLRKLGANIERTTFEETTY